MQRIWYNAMEGQAITTQLAAKERQDLASLIDLYRLRCQVEGKSPNTITAYRETLTRFQRIAREEGPRAVQPGGPHGGEVEVREARARRGLALLGGERHRRPLAGDWMV